MFERLRAFKRKHGHTRVPIDFYDQTLVRWVRTQRGNATRKPKPTLTGARRGRLESIEFSFSHRDGVWESQLRNLEEYKRIHGHCDVPRFDKQFPGLGLFVSRVRVQRKEGRLPPARHRLLSALGLSFEVRERRWRERLAAIGRWRRKYGHPNVPASAGSLGSWLNQQRNRFRKKRLTSAQVADLERLGVWLRRTPPWERRFGELVAFKKAHGHVQPSTTTALGHWVSYQRGELKRGALDPQKARRLKELGFTAKARWRFPEHPLWRKNLELLTAFRAKHGHCLVPLNHPLGPFASRMRQLRRQGRLSDDMKARLDALDFVWSPLDARWEKVFAQLVAYKSRHGHVLGPFRIHYPVLSQWVCTQRRYKKRGTLSARRVERLEQLGLEWTGDRGRAQLWAELDLVSEFRRRQGHLAIPNEPPHRRLYEWAREQRRLFARGELATRVKAELLSLDFPFTRAEVEWERKYANLRSLHERMGTIRRARGELGKWVVAQRRAQLRGHLSLFQEDRLLELGVFG